MSENEGESIRGVLKLQILSLKNIKEHKDPSFVFFETVALFF